MRLLRTGARSDGKHPAVRIQGRDAKVKDEKHGFAFKKDLSFSFLSGFISCQRSGGKLAVKEYKPNIDIELLFALRRQRCLYHPLGTLTDRQQVAETNPPELLLEAILGRCKPVEKPQGLYSELRAIKANWQKVSTQIDPERKTAGYDTANRVQETISRFSAAARPKRPKSWRCAGMGNLANFSSELNAGFHFASPCKTRPPFNRKDCI